MWVHTETETFAVDRWEENREDFADSRRHGEQMRGRQPGEAGRRKREERSKGSTEGRGNE